MFYGCPAQLMMYARGLAGGDIVTVTGSEAFPFRARSRRGETLLEDSGMAISRRHFALLMAMTPVLTQARSGAAQVSDLSALLPSEDEVPDGLRLVEEGGRGKEEIGSGFSDPQRGTQLLTEWGWDGNVYRNFSGAGETVTERGTFWLEVSLHKFASVQTATEAADYFAEDRAAIRDLTGVPVERVANPTIAIGGQTGDGFEVTVYTLAGSVLVRVSAIAERTGNPVVDATAVARVVVGSGGSGDISPALAALLPEADEMPVPLQVVEEGSRTEEEIAFTFEEPSEAADLLDEWGWRDHAYRNYAAPDGEVTGRNAVSRAEVSLHEFESDGSASEALRYYALTRAEALDIEPAIAPLIGDAARVIKGELPTGEGVETTVYVRLGNLLARISLVSPNGDPSNSALEVAKLVVSKSES